MKLAKEQWDSLPKLKKDVFGFMMDFFRRFLANQSFTDVKYIKFVEILMHFLLIYFVLDECICTFKGDWTVLCEGGKAFDGLDARGGETARAECFN